MSDLDQAWLFLTPVIVSGYGRSSKKPLGSGFDQSGVTPKMVKDINRTLSHDSRGEQVLGKGMLMLLVVGVVLREITEITGKATATKILAVNSPADRQSDLVLHWPDLC